MGGGIDGKIGVIDDKRRVIDGKIGVTDGKIGVTNDKIGVTDDKISVINVACHRHCCRALKWRDGFLSAALFRSILLDARAGRTRSQGNPYSLPQYSALKIIGKVACVWPRCCGRKPKRTMRPLP